MTTDSGNYGARATALRETAKWIAAIFAGAGAVLFSGLSFTNIEKVANSGAWLAPVLLAVVPVLAAAVAVYAAAQVISKRSADAGSLLPGPGMPGLTPAVKRLRDEVENLAPATVAMFGSIGKFEERLADVRERVTTAEAMYANQPTPENRKAVDAEYEKLASLQDGVRDLLLCADFVQVDKRYRGARWTMLIAACLGVFGAAASGVVAARAAPDQVRAAAITSPVEVRVHLTTNNAPGPCPIENGQRATAIGGTLTRPLLLFPALPTEGEAPDTCHVPWTWSPPSGAVVIVPTSDGGIR